METRTESIHATDGAVFEGHLTIPPGGHGPGLLLIQEIFGVNDYIREVGDRLATLGYVVLAPDVFWREQPGFELDSSTQASLEPAAAMAGRWDPEVGLADLGAALEHLHHVPEVRGATGVIGFCFGGTQAFRVAKQFEPACAVSYYGSGLAEMLGDVQRITCPTMFHFGDNDPYIPIDRVDAIREAAKDNHHAVVHVHPGAGHAFDNHTASHFHDPAAATRAWTETASFLYMHLGGPGLGA